MSKEAEESALLEGVTRQQLGKTWKTLCLLQLFVRCALPVDCYLDVVGGLVPLDVKKADQRQSEIK
jgi:hypothetical protein